MAEATQPTTAPVHGPTLKREMGPTAILFSSVGVVIGSGLLLGAYHATLVAGRAAIVSWVIGALAILILGLNLAGLGGMYSVAGGQVRSPFSFGSLAGFCAGWFYFFLGSVTTGAHPDAGGPHLRGHPLLTYATVRISVAALRPPDPDRPRPFKLPGLVVLAPAGFIIANEPLLFAASGWYGRCSSRWSSVWCFS